MVMELGSARWTDNTPRPFGPAPGGGVGSLGSTRWTSTVPTPFGPAPGGGSFGGVYDSGFAADPVTEYGEGEMADDWIVKGEWDINVIKKPVAAGKVPSMVLQFFITDRGIADKASLDKDVHDFLKASGYKVSLKTSFQTVPVTWKWAKEASVPGLDFYHAAIATPAKYAGLWYAGSAMSDTIYTPSDELLKKVPNHVYIYTMALTSASNTMTDGDSAQALTLIKQGLINMNRDLGVRIYTQINATITGCPHSVFVTPVKPVVKGVISSLILIAAWNMIATQIGSERL
jgi:hypothetical protein